MPNYSIAPPLKYFIAQCWVILHYLKLSFWPDPLCLDYFRDYSQYQSYIPCLVLLLIFAEIALLMRKHPRIAFLGIAFFLVLFPTSSFFPLRDIEAERRVYLSLAAVTTGAVLGVHRAIQIIFHSKAMRKVLGLTMGVAVVLCFGTMTVQRNEAYLDPSSLWIQALKMNPSNWRARVNIADALSHDKRFYDKMIHEAHLNPDTLWDRDLKINPSNWRTRINFAQVLFERGLYDEAIENLKAVISENPSCVRVSGEDLTQSTITYPWPKKGLKDVNENVIGASAFKLLGLCYASMGNSDQAIRNFIYAVKLAPWHDENYVNLGSALANANRFEDALVYYQIALDINPASESALANLAKLKQIRPDLVTVS